jgi:hypothetical protein
MRLHRQQIRQALMRKLRHWLNRKPARRARPVDHADLKWLMERSLGGDDPGSIDRR